MDIGAARDELVDHADVAGSARIHERRVSVRIGDVELSAPRDELQQLLEVAARACMCEGRVPGLRREQRVRGQTDANESACELSGGGLSQSPRPLR